MSRHVTAIKSQDPHFLNSQWIQLEKPRETRVPSMPHYWPGQEERKVLEERKRSIHEPIKLNKPELFRKPSPKIKSKQGNKIS